MSGRRPLVTISLGALAALAICAGLLAISDRDQGAGEERRIIDAAHSLASQSVRRYGITRLASDVHVVTLDGNVLLIGQGLDDRGVMREVRVTMSRGRFGETEQWQVVRILIDGRAVWNKPLVSPD